MIQNRITRFIHEASQSLALAMMLMFDKGVIGLETDWLERGCDPSQHLGDIMRVLDMQSVAGLSFMVCGCIVFLTNEHVYVNGSEAHDPLPTGPEIAQKLVLYDPEHFDDINTHPIPFDLMGNAEEESIQWESMMEKLWKGNNE